MTDETREHDSAIAGLHRELQMICAKDGAFTEAELKRIAQIEETLRAEPELRKILVHLERRQEAEKVDLLREQRAAGVVDFGDGMRNLQERQSAERDRYIREYHDAQRHREEARQREEERKHERDRDDGRNRGR